MGFPERIKKLVRERSDGLCEGCGQVDGSEFHHRKYKSRQGRDTIDNCLHLCGWGNHTGCHGLAHSANPPPGWSVHSWENPADVEVLRRGVLCFLTDDNEVIPA